RRPSREPLELEQRHVVLGLDPRRASGLLADLQEAADLIAEVRQRDIVDAASSSARSSGPHRAASISPDDIHSARMRWARAGAPAGGAAKPPSRWRSPTGRLLQRMLVLASRHARPVRRAAQSVEPGVVLVRG